MEETISLQEILQTLKKRLGMIIIITFLATAAAGAVSFFVLTPIYQSSTQMLVSQQATGTSSALEAAGFDTDSEYIETYNVIMKSPYILEQVVEEIGSSQDASVINEKINITREGESQVITLTVEDPNPSRAVNIANTTAAVFEREIADLLRVDNVVVLAPAELDDSPAPVKPNPMLNMAIAFVVGLMAAVGLAFLLEFLDNTFRNEEDVEKELGLPVLGSIPLMEKNNSKGTVSQQASSSRSRQERGRERIGS
ncbi:YveK family protein [Alteribacillus sp. YIM 98480]|uniref:YveK family protein n=1 Tax=Alteribacillus sp. YIM 98480 TaxID=2606599 RepID=UPI00131B418E|nr:Wzz/FepE/Etk N-terminal domain-containing protein [Alteribacillus sp. YIM 98480]